MTTRICFVEDDGVLLEGLERTFKHETDFQIAGSYRTAERAWLEADWHMINVLIIDIDLPGMNGIDLITRLASQYRHLLILVYTIAEDRPTVLSAIRRGAHGYLVKDSTAGDVMASVRELLAGGAPMTPRIAREIIRELQPAARPEMMPGAEVLSARELEILQWIALGHSRGKIAGTLFISPATVHSHMKNIYAKLQAHNRTEAINRARDLGVL